MTWWPNRGKAQPDGYVKLQHGRTLGTNVKCIFTIYNLYSNKWEPKQSFIIYESDLHMTDEKQLIIHNKGTILERNWMFE